MAGLVAGTLAPAEAEATGVVGAPEAAGAFGPLGAVGPEAGRGEVTAVAVRVWAVTDTAVTTRSLQASASEVLVRT